MTGGRQPMPVDGDIASQLDRAIEVLQGLRATLHDLQNEVAAAHRINQSPVVLERLRQVVEEVGQNRPARAVSCPEEFILQWKRFTARQGEAPGLRGLRYLCWHPEISVSASFRELLQEIQFEFRARSIQGLVRSCHMEWGPEVRRRGGAMEFASNCLRAYRGPNRVLGRWRANEHVILDHEAFAADMLAAKRSPRDQCALWGVEPQSEFTLSAVECAAERIRAARAKIPATSLRDIIFWDGWGLRRFKQQVSYTLLLKNVEQRLDLPELKALILHDARLRDPRLPANQKNWVGVNKDAHDLFIRWLAADDIEFFFEHVLPKGQDPHGRKPFWLSYLHHVTRSRPLLSENDHFRLKRLEARTESRWASFGRITHPTTSAFMLDFGNVLVVEFSQPGNGCYCFGRELANTVVPDFWNEGAFERAAFRRTDLVPILSAENVGTGRVARGFRFSHMGAWEEKVVRQFALMGIRPR